MRLVVLGLSLSSSWGNGHASVWRALLRAMADRGHDIVFLERDARWYAEHRDLTDPDYCQLEFYHSLADLKRHQALLLEADAVILGSFVPQGIAVARFLQQTVRRLLVFYDIDTPVTLEALEHGRCRYLRPEQVRGFDIYFSFAGGPVPGRIKSRFAARNARPLYCTVDPDQHRPTRDRLRWDLGYLGTYSADRQPGLERLLIAPARMAPELRFVVAGAQYPDTIDWPANVDRIEHLPPAEHPAFYSACRYALNLTRSAMQRLGWAPSVRLFEAAACGAPILSDRWPGLDTFFRPGEDILLADTSEAVLDVLHALPEDRRRAIADHARDTVLARHAAAQRAIELENDLLRALIAHTVKAR